MKLIKNLKIINILVNQSNIENNKEILNDEFISLKIKEIKKEISVKSIEISKKEYQSIFYLLTSILESIKPLIFRDNEDNLNVKEIKEIESILITKCLIEDNGIKIENDCNIYFDEIKDNSLENTRILENYLNRKEEDLLLKKMKEESILDTFSPSRIIEKQCFNIIPFLFSDKEPIKLETSILNKIKEEIVKPVEKLSLKEWSLKLDIKEEYFILILFCLAKHFEQDKELFDLHISFIERLIEPSDEIIKVSVSIMIYNSYNAINKIASELEKKNIIFIDSMKNKNIKEENESHKYSGYLHNFHELLNEKDSNEYFDLEIKIKNPQ